MTTDGWVEPTYYDAFGNVHEVPETTLEVLRELFVEPAGGPPLFVHPPDTAPVEPGELILEAGTRLEVRDRLPPDLPLGYHRLVTGDGERAVIASPGRCHLPDDLRGWGWSAQLYATRSHRSWGMGDFADLRELVRWSRDLGAEMALVNPVLAVSPTLPQQPSPYYPASRRFLNPIYLRVEEVPGAEEVSDRLPAAVRAGRALNRRDVIDRDAVWRLKVEVLKVIWGRAAPPEEFERWRRSQGPALSEFAAWCVLAEEHGADWRRWPPDYRHPTSRGVGRLIAERTERIRFHQWLQWLCRLQLDGAAHGIMLLQDLPIGFDPGGADAWAWQDLLAPGVSIGAPPDEFNTRGQKWGIPPFVPNHLAAAAYEPFVQTIRTGLAEGGGLRIDHVLGLFRQFWIPDDASPREGAYVRFPADDLLDIVALESVRAGAVVVGEDLGTVPPGVREELARRRLLSYRLLWFEHDEPPSWPQLSMASVTTHDLPTVAGLWTGADLAEQKTLDMSPNEESTLEMRSRVARLAGLDDSAGLEQAVTAVHRRLAEAPSMLMCATLDDLARTERRPNLPGADEVRPNWSLPLPMTFDEMMADPLAAELADVFNRSIRSPGGPA